MSMSKYVVIENDWGPTTPIIFPAWIDHGDAAKFVRGKVISAGFCEIVSKNGDIEVITFGHSQRLNIGPDKYDAQMIKTLIKG